GGFEKLKTEKRDRKPNQDRKKTEQKLSNQTEPNFSSVSIFYVWKPNRTELNRYIDAAIIHLFSGFRVCFLEIAIGDFKYSLLTSKHKEKAKSLLELSKDKEEDPEFLLPFEKLRTILIPDWNSEYLPTEHVQTLLLINCGKIKELPENMGNLISLRYLALTINQHHLPKVIGRLTSLRTLYITACKYLISFGEGVRTLTNLRTLVMLNCQNMKSLSCYMTALENLAIYNCSVLDLTRSGEGIRGLQSFKTGGVAALASRESANTLKTLHLGYCTYLELLPEWFENLTFLQQIKIRDCSLLSDFPKGMHRLTALRELEINNCPLTRRCKREEGVDLHKIAHVPKIILNGQII
ncbi:hypothetical protein DVH24_008162, partial [Malus domestica]